MNQDFLIQDLLNQIYDNFKYDQNQKGLIWKSPKKYNPSLENKPVGSKHSSGYIHVNWLGKQWKEHHLVWIYHNQQYPKGVIDHINGDKSDNRIENLRDVSIEQNRQNVKKAQKNNKLGILGVQQRKSGKFRARIRHNNVLHSLGTFNTLQEAINAYKLAKQLLHKGYVDES